jgi:hypothetical protein
MSSCRNHTTHSDSNQTQMTSHNHPRQSNTSRQRYHKSLLVGRLVILARTKCNGGFGSGTRVCIVVFRIWAYCLVYQVPLVESEVKKMGAPGISLEVQFHIFSVRLFLMRSGDLSWRTGFGRVVISALQGQGLLSNENQMRRYCSECCKVLLEAA